MKKNLNHEIEGPGLNIFIHGVNESPEKS